MRVNEAMVRLGWLGVWALAGCFDHGDGLAAGSGGAGGTSGSGGFGGFGGSGGFVVGGSGFAGDGCFDCGGGGGEALPSCPFDDPNCTEELRGAACDELIECSTVAGPRLSRDLCLGQIDTRCVQCMRALGADGADGGLADDGGAAELAACNDAFEGSECDDFCDLLIQPPQSSFECEALAKGELALSPIDAQCMCTNCFFQLEQCVFDDGCWLIAQCAGRTGCVGTGCFTEEACLPVIDAVGATSLGANLITQLADCTNAFCAVVPL